MLSVIVIIIIAVCASNTLFEPHAYNHNCASTSILYYTCVCECIWCTCGSKRTDKRDLHPIFFLIRGPAQRMILTRRFPLHCSVDRSADTNPHSRRMCKNILYSAFPISHRIWYYYHIDFVWNISINITPNGWT